MNARQKAKLANKYINSMRDVIEEKNKKIDSLEYENKRLNNQVFDNETLKKVLAFAITNQVGGLQGGMMVDMFAIDKMKDIDVRIEKCLPQHSYKIVTNYRQRIYY